MADTLVLGTSAERRGGSTPFTGINKELTFFVDDNEIHAIVIT